MTPSHLNQAGERLDRAFREAELDASVAAAEGWVEVARPLVVAMGDLDEMENTLRWRALPDHPRVGREASCYVADARRYIEEMLEGIRDDFLCDQRRSVLAGMGEEEIDAVDAFNDALDEQVTSVRDAVKRIERQEYEAFIRGDRK